MAKAQLNFGELGGSNVIVDDLGTINNTADASGLRTATTSKDFTGCSKIGYWVSAPSLGADGKVMLEITNVTSNSITYKLIYYPNGDYSSFPYDQHIILFGI